MLSTLERPLVCSSCGVRGTCNQTGTLQDRHIERIALSGGLISISFSEDAICGTTVQHIVNAIKYVKHLVGIEYVGIGSNFDGGTTTIFDTSRMKMLTRSLLEEESEEGGEGTGTAGGRSTKEFSKEDVKKIMGDNALRMLGALLPRK